MKILKLILRTLLFIGGIILIGSAFGALGGIIAGKFTNNTKIIFITAYSCSYIGIISFLTFNFIRKYRTSTEKMKEEKYSLSKISKIQNLLKVRYSITFILVSISIFTTFVINLTSQGIEFLPKNITDELLTFRKYRKFIVYPILIIFVTIMYFIKRQKEEGEEEI